MAIIDAGATPALYRSAVTFIITVLYSNTHERSTNVHHSVPSVNAANVIMCLLPGHATRPQLRTETEEVSLT